MILVCPPRVAPALSKYAMSKALAGYGDAARQRLAGAKAD